MCVFHTAGYLHHVSISSAPGKDNFNLTLSSQREEQYILAVVSSWWALWGDCGCPSLPQPDWEIPTCGRRLVLFLIHLTLSMLRKHQYFCIMALYEASHFCMSSIKRKRIKRMGSMVRCQGKENKGVTWRTLHLFGGDFTEMQIEGRDSLTAAPQNSKIKYCFAGGQFSLSASI